jgi:hypothetical protein
MTQEEEKFQQRVREVYKVVDKIIVDYNITGEEMFSLLSALYANLENLTIDAYEDCEQPLDYHREIFFDAVDLNSKYQDIKSKQRKYVSFNLNNKNKQNLN